MPLGGEGRWRCDAASSPARCDAARRSRGVMPPRDDGGGATLPCVTGGGVMLPRGDDGAMPLRDDDGAMPSSRVESARGRQRWCDAIVVMKSWCEANNCCGEMPRQDVVMASVATASSMKRCVQ
jgi:hypothetical protein